MSEPFTNEPIAVDGLPQLDAESFVSVDPRYVWGQIVGIVGIAAVVAGVTVVIVWRSGAIFWPAVVGGGIVVLLAALAIAAFFEAQRLGYQLRQHDLSLRSGLVRHRVETIPFSRIQHVSVGRGVIERSLGLATLQVSSAGPDIAVPGLPVADAERIKQVVATRAGVDDEPHDDQPHDDQLSDHQLSDDQPDGDDVANHWAPPSPPSPPPVEQAP